MLHGGEICLKTLQRWRNINAQDRQSKQIQKPGAQCSWEFTEQTNLKYEVLNVTENQTG